MPPRASDYCTIIQPGALCSTLNADPFTLIITLWTGLQLVWVAMLLTVQLLQIARGLTTYEAMTPPKPLKQSDAASANFVTGGDANMTATDPHAGHNHGPGGHDHGPGGAGGAHKHGPLDAWKRLLGVDTFMAVAVQGRGSKQARSSVFRNPFSRGFLTNCSDFWANGEPWFASQDGGAARLGGERVNYTEMYEVPSAPGYVPVRMVDEEV